MHRRAALLGAAALLVLVAPARAEHAGSTTPRLAGFVDAGADHTCVVLATGDARCFGSDAFGQLGNDAPESGSPSPVPVALPDGAVAVAAGTRHTCVVVLGGSVRCAGDGSLGELGNPSWPPGVPIGVPLPARATAVSAGWASSCALLVGGQIWCWGTTVAGDLPAFSPVRVSLPAAATTVSSGQEHACARLTTGAVYCWGSDAAGQLGDGAPDATHKGPVRVALGSPAVSVAAGYDHACALLASGAVRCWGRNGSGQLGNGGHGIAPAPVPVTLAAARAVAAGLSHTCAVLRTGALACWGSDGWGELGDGLPLADRATPVPVPTTAPVVAVTAGASHTCVLLSTGQVTCFGDDSSGQLGNGPAFTGLQPSALLAPPALGGVATGVADIALAMTPLPAQIQRGQRLTVTITVTNAGPASSVVTVRMRRLRLLHVGPPTATQGAVTVDDILPGVDTWRLGGVRAGASAVLTLRLGTRALAGVARVQAGVATASAFDPDSRPGRVRPGDDDDASSAAQVELG
jgi:alpha-tubulin suppressor-like RCC1 family protein